MEIEYSLLTTHYSITSYYKYVVYIYQICEEAENFLTSLKYDHCGFFGQMVPSSSVHGIGRK